MKPLQVLLVLIGLLGTSSDHRQLLVHGWRRTDDGLVVPDPQDINITDINDQVNMLNFLSVEAVKNGTDVKMFRNESQVIIRRFWYPSLVIDVLQQSPATTLSTTPSPAPPDSTTRSISTAQASTALYSSSGGSNTANTTTTTSTQEAESHTTLINTPEPSYTTTHQHNTPINTTKINTDTLSIHTTNAPETPTVHATNATTIHATNATTIHATNATTIHATNAPITPTIQTTNATTIHLTNATIIHTTPATTIHTTPAITIHTTNATTIHTTNAPETPTIHTTAAERQPLQTTNATTIHTTITTETPSRYTTNTTTKEIETPTTITIYKTTKTPTNETIKTPNTTEGETTTTMSTTTTTMSSISPAVTVVNVESLNFTLNLAFTSDLTNPLSAAFLILTEWIKNEINVIYKITFNISYSHCEIISLEPGSVKVNAKLFFREVIPSIREIESTLISALEKNSTKLPIVGGSVHAGSLGKSSGSPSTAFFSTATLLLLCVLLASQTFLLM